MLRKLWQMFATLSLASCHDSCKSPASTWIGPADPNVAVMGRADRSTPARLTFGYPGVTLRLRFEGTALAIRASSTTENSAFTLQIAGQAPRLLRIAKGGSELVLAEGLAHAAHSLELVHRTETWQGIVTVHGFLLPAGGRLLPPEPWPARRLLVIGDSVTSGEAIERRADCKKDSISWNPSRSYGMLLARALDAQCHLVCFGGRGLIRDWQGRRDVLNAPQFFDLSIADSEAPVAWDHASYAPDVVLVSLGTNDFNLALGELPGREEYVSAFLAFAVQIRARYPSARVILTEGAIVNDEADPKRPQKTTLRAYLAETIRRLADPRLEFAPSRHYPGDRCDAHPTAEQHAAMAKDLESAVRRAGGW